MHAAAPAEAGPSAVHHMFSPRWVLQRWGTEYRRAQDPEYWLKQATLWVKAWLDVIKEDGEHHAGLVNTSVRFPNEQEWIDDVGGVVWHVCRPDRGHYASQLDYISEQGLPVRGGDRVIWNTGTIEQLNTAVSLLLQSPAGDKDNTPLGAVMCGSCGKLHQIYNIEQVIAEIALVDMSIAAADYIGCVACGHRVMVPIDQVDTGSLPPVLYEAVNNGE